MVVIDAHAQTDLAATLHFDLTRFSRGELYKFDETLWENFLSALSDGGSEAGMPTVARHEGRSDANCCGLQQ